VVQVRLQRRLPPHPHHTRKYPGHPLPGERREEGRGAGGPASLRRWPLLQCGASWSRRTTPPSASSTPAGPARRASTAARAPRSPRLRASAHPPGGPSARALLSINQGDFRSIVRKQSQIIVSPSCICFTALK
jgi:hypothetical protein